MDLEKFERHIGKPYKFKINEDEFEIKPVQMAYLSDLVTAYSIFRKMKAEEDILRFQEFMEEEHLEAFKNIVWHTLKISYPDIPEEKLETFGIRNFFTILGAIFVCNQFAVDESKRDAIMQRVEQLRKAKEDVSGSTSG